ncbi:SixA phosphatase family protein [Roseomonas elaeocarpi]|uniref:Histidine phosphatase family protein n=1 Tax=Roseomonas elaeocarpi TaxID=907779 RepID=A0ABV6JT03_9PROT
MKQLLLLRHAKSSWDDPALSDHARGLNPRGRRAAAAMGQAMAAAGLRPAMVLVSSARRTLQTLDLLRLDGAKVEVLDTLYLASPDALLDAVAMVPEEVASLMVVAHNPGLHELAVRLAGKAALAASEGPALRLNEGYPTGTLTEFSLATSWDAAGPGGASMRRFLAPRDLPELADSVD